jgi:hypothetical protein
MWESCLYGSVRGRKTTVAWKRCCGTVAKAGGNRENKHLPAAPEGSCLLEGNLAMVACRVGREAKATGPPG